MKKPGECLSIDEVRAEIDTVDKEIINLLGKRLLYIRRIVRFKKNEEDVMARKRYTQVLQARRKWAFEQGIDPDIIENVYRTLMQYFIDEQKKIMKID